MLQVSHGSSLGGVVPHPWKRLTSSTDTKPKKVATASTTDFGPPEASLNMKYDSLALALAGSTIERGGSSSMTSPSFHVWLIKKLEEESPTHP